MADVSVPGKALDGDGVNVHEIPVAVPTFRIVAVKACVLPPVSGAVTVAGLSVMEAGWSVMATGVAQRLGFAVMQTPSVTVVGIVIGFGAV